MVTVEASADKRRSTDAGFEKAVGKDLTLRIIANAVRTPGQVGDKVDVRVTNIDMKTRRMGLSIKAREIAEEKEAVEQYGSSDSGASLGDILGAALKGDE